MEVLEVLKSRLEKLEQALKQVPNVELDAEKWAELFAGNEGRPVNEGDRQEARKMLQWCKEHGYPATNESCLEWAITEAWERRGSA
jgi:hypothetical protein